MLKALKNGSESRIIHNKQTDKAAKPIFIIKVDLAQLLLNSLFPNKAKKLTIQLPSKC
tara:strand:- start:354 stop:527 length:174 start_codon:yes stop_codon:yes gene_type:complete